MVRHDVGSTIAIVLFSACGILFQARPSESFFGGTNRASRRSYSSAHATTTAFTLCPPPNNNNNRRQRVSVILFDSNEKTSGSFFNQIPEDSGTNDNDDNNNQSNEFDITDSADNDKNLPNAVEEPFEKNISELLKRRTSAPPPSTVGGVPTSKLSSLPDATTKPHVEIDPTGGVTVKGANAAPLDAKTDDQGYTLYENKDTGEQSRVFDALVEFPTNFKLKIVGENDGTFASEIVALVAENCNVDAKVIPFSERKNGKWVSVTVTAPVESSDMLYKLYENIDRDPRVRFKF